MNLEALQGDIVEAAKSLTMGLPVLVVTDSPEEFLLTHRLGAVLLRFLPAQSKKASSPNPDSDLIPLETESKKTESESSSSREPRALAACVVVLEMEAHLIFKSSIVHCAGEYQEEFRRGLEALRFPCEGDMEVTARHKVHAYRFCQVKEKYKVDFLISSFEFTAQKKAKE